MGKKAAASKRDKNDPWAGESALAPEDGNISGQRTRRRRRRCGTDGSDSLSEDDEEKPRGGRDRRGKASEKSTINAQKKSDDSAHGCDQEKTTCPDNADDASVSQPGSCGRANRDGAAPGTPEQRPKRAGGDGYPLDHLQSRDPLAPSGPGLYGLKCHHGKHIRAEANGDITTTGTTIGDAEKFELVRNEDGTVSFKSHYGKYLAAEKNGHVRAARSAIGDLERLEMITNADGSVSLRSHSGLFLAATRKEVIANRGMAGAWDKFQLKARGKPKPPAVLQEAEDEPAAVKASTPFF
eukprot:gnl/TRDRNA2_/TRDRNA2_172676_c0_seq1.p1 gnl/TRDRNA2_/TRDRNA2_172676_c0~~gnl/TRDRNA2_/TRDRNA2_172676_c0_seq1.p1  ORF type:complete len:296 (+),score=62.28 gnl/TRDRNA2_/TRDRNA2_172676_c0_seq1:64-951(+)